MFPPGSHKANFQEATLATQATSATDESVPPKAKHRALPLAPIEFPTVKPGSRSPSIRRRLVSAVPGATPGSLSTPTKPKLTNSGGRQNEFVSSPSGLKIRPSSSAPPSSVERFRQMAIRVPSSAVAVPRLSLIGDSETTEGIGGTPRGSVLFSPVLRASSETFAYEPAPSLVGYFSSSSNHSPQRPGGGPNDDSVSGAEFVSSAEGGGLHAVNVNAASPTSNPVSDWSPFSFLWCGR
jgi:hypothetical protein